MSKGKQTMSKVITRKLNVGDKFKISGNPYEVYEVVDIKGDFVIYKNIGSNEEYSMVRGFAQTVDLVDESADYQKKRFKEPAYMYESVSSKNIKSGDDLYEWMTEYMRKHGSNRFTSLQFILGNGNNIVIAWDMKSYKGIHEGSKDYTMSEFVYKFMEPIIQNSGISSIYEADMDTGRFKPTKEEVIVIHHPWGEEIKDYKAGDPIPAGTEYKIFKTRDQKAIDAWIDSLYESTKKLNEEYYIKWGKKYFCNMNGDPAWGPIKDFAIPFKSREEADKYMDKMSDMFPMFNYNYDIKVVKESTKITEAQERKKDYLAIVKRFRSDINKHIDKVERDIDRGFAIDYSDRDEAQVLGTRFSAELLRYNLAVENKTLTEGFIISDTSTNDKPVYFHYGKYTGYDWGFDKNAATKFSTKEAADKMIEKMRQEGAIVKDMKVIEEGRIAKGYENLDADERAKHLLSHPSSKYMSDLKSENITERAIRKAVKEMLGKPDKDDPQFIIDVNEEGEASAIANTTAEVANPDLPLKLKEDLESDKTEALEDYKKAKAEYLANKSDENWKKFSDAKAKCMQLGCRI